MLLSLRVQETGLMMKYYKKCPSREKSIIVLQNDQNSEKPQDGKYTAVQKNKLNLQTRHALRCRNPKKANIKFHCTSGYHSVQQKQSSE